MIIEIKSISKLSPYSLNEKYIHLKGERATDLRHTLYTEAYNIIRSVRRSAKDYIERMYIAKLSRCRRHAISRLVESQHYRPSYDSGLLCTMTSAINRMSTRGEFTRRCLIPINRSSR